MNRAIWQLVVIDYDTRTGQPVVAALMPDGHLLPCRYYNKAWHVIRDALGAWKASQAARGLADAVSRWGEVEQRPPRYPNGRKPQRVGSKLHVWLTAYDQDPNLPRDQLPDQMDVHLAAGFAGIDQSQIRRLCRSGEIRATKDFGPWRGWLIDTTSLLRWMVRTKRREPNA